MMKKLLEKQIVFNAILRVLAFFAKKNHFDRITHVLTQLSAQVNIRLNRPQPVQRVDQLAKSWQEMMPPDGQHFFKIAEVSADTAYTEIHLRCPLRGSGNVAACHKLMNYDRQLMDAIGGQLIVLESQANSGKNYCRLAIRRKADKVGDLSPAYQPEIAKQKK